jgi:hypothetical protein
VTFYLAHLRKSRQLFSGFWEQQQPDPKFGECVDVALSDDAQSWELTTCESLLPFMCRANACPAGAYNILILYRDRPNSTYCCVVSLADHFPQFDG